MIVYESNERKHKVWKDHVNHYKFVDFELPSNVLFFTFDRKLLQRDILFGGIYFPPEGSQYFDRTAFTNLESSISMLNCQALCLLGDFNARTASLPDTVDLVDGENIDDIGYDVTNYQLPVRFSNDCETNVLGLDMIDFCKTLNTCIVNGRSGDHHISKRCTCKDASVVDYFIVSHDLFSSVGGFCVHDFCELYSDVHCPVSMRLHIDHSVDVQVENVFTVENDIMKNNVSNIPCRPKWHKDSEQKYKDGLDRDKIDRINNALTHLLSTPTLTNNTQEQINSFGIDISSIIKNAASTAGLFKKNKQRKRKQRKNENFPWFDKDCETKRKVFLKAKNSFKRCKSAEAKEHKSKLSKSYKRQLRLSFRKYQKSFIKKVKGLKSNDPKSFWKLLNGTYQEKQETHNVMTCKTFYDYFKDLGTVQKDEQTESPYNDNDNNNNNTKSNEVLDVPFTVQEVKNAIRKLKNNKACGIDQITNELLKAATDNLVLLITNFFNLVMFCGKVPEEWTIAIVKPLYKQKGNKDSPANYRGISLLSCFGKLFTSVINNRLGSYLDNNNTIGEEQAGFRAGYSGTDHIFTLHSIINFFLAKKKRLYCAFIDYEKAFDLVDRSFLWVKMINENVTGKLLCVIQDLYSKAKSQVQWNQELSGHFSCTTGVRQGENLSPLLFALFLNDLSSFIGESVDGLESIKKAARDIDIDDAHVNILFKMFILLYADDTVILAETPDSLQNALNKMQEYCTHFRLKVNALKTKVMVFSRGKIRNLPEFTYNGVKLDVVFDFVYLGMKMNYNGSFKPAQKHLYNRASRAMFSLITKMKKLMLPIDIQIELFDRIVVPILLYGSEVWYPQMCDLATKLQLRFYKIILKLNKSTPSQMIFGELGQFPLDVQAKQRMLNFWFRLTDPVNKNKFSSKMYYFLLKLKEKSGYSFSFLDTIELELNALGSSDLWLNQRDATRCSSHTFKVLIKQRVKDQFIQKWYMDINNNELYYNYRMYKNRFEFEKYLAEMPFDSARFLLKFRVLNHKLPIQKGRFLRIERNERKCNKCNCNELGDEYHYLFLCPVFHDVRIKFLKPYFYRRPNAIKYENLMCSEKKNVLFKLVRFIKAILADF